MTAHKLDPDSFCSHVHLTEEDLERLEKLSDVELVWTKTEKLKEILKFSADDDLLKWLRKQSVNRVEMHLNKPVHKLTVIKTYSYDPANKEAFVAVCPLFTGRDFNWWD